MGITKYIMKLNTYNNKSDISAWYKTSCACGSDNHDCTIVLEKDKEHPVDVSMVFYKKISWADYYGKSNIIARMLKRIQCSLKILFTGYIELEEDFIFHNEQHIDNFIEAMKEGKNTVKEEWE